MRLPLKNYQNEAIHVLSRYCAGIRQCMARENPRPERLAYEAITERDYYTPPGFEGVPYVCMRIPTGGGGKTLMAAHAVGTIGDKLLGTDRPVGLWITPSTTIRDQTLRGLQTSELSANFERNVVKENVASHTLSIKIKAL